jgi:hypothetical protein
MIRKEPAYRHEAFLGGLAAAGYEAIDASPMFPVKPGELLVSWNRYFDRDQLCERFEREGGTCLIAENGYVRGRHDDGDYYAIAVHGHNGSGQWRRGGTERWHSLGVELKPWRSEGNHILVAANRPFGMRGTIMPNDWAQDVEKRLRAQTKLEVRVRLHPGNNRPAVPLDEDLEDARAVVIWSSSVGVKALLAGIPVVCEAPFWICKSATSPTLAEALSADLADLGSRRLAALHDLAYAQWSVPEIASGQAFRWLLQQ